MIRLFRQARDGLSCAFGLGHPSCLLDRSGNSGRKIGDRAREVMSRHVSGKEAGSGPQAGRLAVFISSVDHPFIARNMAEQAPHLRATYNEIHKLIRESAQRIADFKPNMFIAIGHSEFLSPLTRRAKSQTSQAEGQSFIPSIGLIHASKSSRQWILPRSRSCAFWSICLTSYSSHPFGTTAHFFERRRYEQEYPHSCNRTFLVRAGPGRYLRRVRH